MIPESQDLLTRVIIAYGSAEQLAHARDHYLADNKPLSLTDKVECLNLHSNDCFSAILEVNGAFLAPDFFS